MPSNDISNCPTPKCDIKSCQKKTCIKKSCPVKTCPVKTCPLKRCPIKICPILDLYTIPKKILLVTNTPGNTFVDLSWNEPDDGGSNINNYRIQYKKYTDLSTNWTNLFSTTTSIKVTNLINDTKYLFRVQAINYYGLGIPSDIIEVTPTIQNNIMLYVKILGVFIIGIFLLYLVIMLFSNNNSDKAVVTEEVEVAKEEVEEEVAEEVEEKKN